MTAAPPLPSAPPAPPHLRTRRIVTVPPRPHSEDEAARGPRPLQLLDADDLHWIARLTDVVARLEGQPWRLALDAIESGEWDASAPAAAPGTGRAPREISARRLNAATAALRRLLAGRPHEAELARKARSLLLGVPALDEQARASRVSSVATLLELTPAAVERVLWADVPRERPIDLRGGRPTATEVAALANVGLLQRALARAHSLELVIRGDASPILRGSAARGLIATASERDAAVAVADNAAAAVPAADTAAANTASSPDHAAHHAAAHHASAHHAVAHRTGASHAGLRETVLDITGPLALCHGTAVYGRALGNLVPLLASCETFTLTIRAEARGNHYELRVDSPALLPAAAPRRWPLVERLAVDLERVGAPHGVRVRRSPPVLVQTVGRGGALVCPDLGIDVGERVVWVEIVGFWTPEYLARKLARYRAVGAGDVVLCVDASRACDDDDPPAGACVVRFQRRVHAQALLQLLGVV